MSWRYHRSSPALLAVRLNLSAGKIADAFPLH
jgi:hypothetical protein